MPDEQQAHSNKQTYENTMDSLNHENLDNYDKSVK